MFPLVIIAAAVAGAALAERASKPAISKARASAMASATAAGRTFASVLGDAFAPVAVTDEARAWAENILAKVAPPATTLPEARQRCDNAKREIASRVLAGRLTLDRGKALDLAATLTLWASSESDASKRAKLLDWAGKLAAGSATYAVARAALDLDESAEESFIEGAVEGIKRFGSMLKSLWS